jgi:hypothetical protein
MFKEDCNDCEWSETWEGGFASDDPGVQHAKETGHTLTTTVVRDASSSGGDDE